MSAFDKRFAYLAGVLEEDQDKELFETTKSVLSEVFEHLKFDKTPDIGVDDSGRAIAEWHNYDDYTVISIIPFSADKILFEGLKKNATVFTISTTLQNLKENNNNELLLELTHNHALSA
ncbi:hypothetical protein [Treponema primitia]|uniref:hypothetical protein n=1 Tax=Treponema primitia TaxID=88058 RepID=UPI0002555251|nr:hypothetical protein [Treponema primitia]